MLSIEPSVHATPQACVADFAPPTFAGIASLLALANGALRAAWLAATDSTPPVVYDVYILAGSATGLFATGNRVLSAFGLQVDVFQLPDGSPLVAGTTYFVGVRARDAVGNLDSNVVSLSAISAGVLSTTLAALANTLLAAVEAAGGGVVGVVEEDSVVGTVDDEDEIIGIVEEC